MNNKTDRRALLKRSLLATACALVGVPIARSYAQALQPIAANDVTAKGLDYHPDATTVDVNDYPEYETSQRCANCAHFVDGSQHGCKLMPGKEVKVNGWCKVWSAKS